MFSHDENYQRILTGLTADGRHAYSVKDAAKALGICVATLWKLANQDKLRLTRFGGRTTVSASELARLLVEGA